MVLLGLLVCAAVRIALPLRCGAVSADDVKVLLDCFEWLQSGDPSGLLGVDSSAGFIYIGLHHFVWAALAGAVSFKLLPLYLVHAVLLTLPALFIIRWTTGLRTGWTSAFALTSPLAIYFSLQLLPLWWISMLGGTLALVLASRLESESVISWKTVFLVGLVQGYLIGVYPSLAAVSAGLGVCLLLYNRNVARILAYVAGCIAGLIPLGLLVVSRWDILRPKVQVSSTPIQLIELFSVGFRYWGLPMSVHLHRGETGGELEQALSAGTLWIWAILALSAGPALFFALRKDRRVPVVVALGYLSTFFLLLYSLITRSESWHHQGTNLWWVAPVLIPWIVNTCYRTVSPWILGGFLIFNITSAVVVFGPRAFLGTTAERGFVAGRGLGPSWWMQEKLAQELHGKVLKTSEQHAEGLMVVRCDQIYRLPHSLPALYRMQYPSDAGRIAWAPEGGTKCDWFVTHDRGNQHAISIVRGPGSLRDERTQSLRASNRQPTWDTIQPDWPTLLASKIRRSGAAWRNADGHLRLTCESGRGDSDHAALIWEGPEVEDVVVEMQLRLLEYPTRNDVGIVFAHTGAGEAQFAYLHGQGAVYLANISTDGRAVTVGGNNWYWKPKRGRTVLLSISKSGPLVEIRVDGKRVYEAANLDGPRRGRVGIGTRRGTGAEFAEIDWIHIKTPSQTEAFHSADGPIIRDR